MRLARGSGVDGLSGMAPVQKLETAAGDLQILRPFLETDPALLAGIVRRAKFDWVEDPSNMDDQFERVRWRQAENMLDGLGLRARALARTAANMRQMRDYLDAQVTDWLQVAWRLSFLRVLQPRQGRFFEPTGTFAPARAAPCDGTHGAGQIRAA